MEVKEKSEREGGGDGGDGELGGSQEGILSSRGKTWEAVGRLMPATLSNRFRQEGGKRSSSVGEKRTSVVSGPRVRSFQEGLREDVV